LTNEVINFLTLFWAQIFFFASTAVPPCTATSIYWRPESSFRTRKQKSI